MASKIDIELDEMKSKVFEKTIVLKQIETKEHWDIFVEKKLAREIIELVNEEYTNLPANFKDEGLEFVLETYKKIEAVADKFNVVPVEEKEKETVACT